MPRRRGGDAATPGVVEGRPAPQHGGMRATRACVPQSGSRSPRPRLSNGPTTIGPHGVKVQAPGRVLGLPHPLPVVRLAGPGTRPAAFGRVAGASLVRGRGGPTRPREADGHRGAPGSSMVATCCGVTGSPPCRDTSRTHPARWSGSNADQARSSRPHSPASGVPGRRSPAGPGAPSGRPRRGPPERPSPDPGPKLVPAWARQAAGTVSAPSRTAGATAPRSSRFPMASRLSGALARQRPGRGCTPVTAQPHGRHRARFRRQPECRWARWLSGPGEVDPEGPASWIPGHTGPGCRAVHGRRSVVCRPEGATSAGLRADLGRAQRGQCRCAASRRCRVHDEGPGPPAGRAGRCGPDGARYLSGNVGRPVRLGGPSIKALDEHRARGTERVGVPPSCPRQVGRSDRYVARRC
jgi:hypothetical protein